MPSPSAVETHLRGFNKNKVQLHLGHLSHRVHLFFIPLGRLWSEQGLVVINFSDIRRILGGMNRRLQMRSLCAAVTSYGFSH
jgi:hypothetical protein